eukprot:g29853.t1
MMRGILVALLCGWALADVPERDESCEPLEDPSVLMQLGTKNGFVAWMKSLSGDVTATCDFDGANPFGIQFIDPLYYCFGNPPTCFCGGNQKDDPNCYLATSTSTPKVCDFDGRQTSHDYEEAVQLQVQSPQPPSASAL